MSITLKDTKLIRKPIILVFVIVISVMMTVSLLWVVQELAFAKTLSDVYFVDGILGQDIPACGTTVTPCKSIEYTVDNRAASGDTIRAAQGVYTENLTIDIPLTLEGGFEPVSWTRDIENYKTIIDGSNSRTIWGDWDGFGIHMSTVITDSGEYKMWYAGWGLTEDGYGLATSTDGITWTKNISNPIVTATEDWEDGSLGHPHVIKDGALYKLWYGPRDQVVGYAWSDDGINWTKYTNNPIMEGTSGTWDESGVGAPFVIKMNANDYRMWYQNGSFDGIGYATSSNGIDWTKHAGSVIDPGADGSWEAEGVADPNVVFDGDNFHMWYSGMDGEAVRIGYAFSGDGITWGKSASNPVLSRGAPSDWDEFGVAEPNVLFDGLDYRMWFSGWQNTWQSPQKGFATSSNGLDWDKYAGSPVVATGTPGAWGQPVVHFVDGSGGSVLDGFTVRNGEARNGGGVLMEDSGATIRNCTLMDNTAHDAGGGIAIRNGFGVVVESNQIISNTVSFDVGSGIFIGWSEVHLDSNYIAYNDCTDHNHGNGAVGIEMWDYSSPVTVTNNVIAANQDKGIMVGIGVQDLEVINNTITGNRNEGIYASNGTTVNLLRNNIITAHGYCGISAARNAAFQTIDHNNVWQNADGNYCDHSGEALIPPVPGVGDISADPQFVDGANGDYHLVADSLCVGSGSSDKAPAYDIEGTMRDAYPDMGAYEWGQYRVLLPLTLIGAGQ